MSNYWPDHFEFVAEVELDNESYSFHLIGVWKNTTTGECVWAEDAGCSCPEPWDGIDWTGLPTLTPGEWRTVVGMVKNSSASMAERASFFGTVENALPSVEES